jgi:hypothetical protein
MNIYTLKTDANYGEVLQINGRDAICPFQAPAAIPQQNQMTGQVTIGFNRMPCSTVCPLAEITKSGHYTLSCGNSAKDYELSETAEVVKSEIPIIKISD